MSTVITPELEKSRQKCADEITRLTDKNKFIGDSAEKYDGPQDIFHIMIDEVTVTLYDSEGDIYQWNRKTGELFNVNGSLIGVEFLPELQERKKVL
jgi:hypothetical protein